MTEPSSNPISREAQLCTQVIQQCATWKRDLYQIANFARELPSLKEQLVPAIENVWNAIDRLQAKANQVGTR